MEKAKTMIRERIAILGCGWLGYPLALELLKLGHEVIGTTTTVSKVPLMEQNGIKAQIIDFSKEFSLETISKALVWILAFPPRTKSTDGEWYVQAILRIVEAAKSYGVREMVLLSSTSVYPDEAGTMHEELQVTESDTGNLALWKAEQLVLKSGIAESYVLRLGGLAGEHRILAKHFAGKTNLPNGDSPVNFLHRQDGIKAILFILHQNKKGGVYNVCSPLHPSRKEVFVNDCLRLGLVQPHFSAGGTQRIVSVDKLIGLGFTFSYPDPMHFFYG